MNIEQSIEEDSKAMERMASAFEVIADTLTAWYKLEQQRFDKQYPVRTPREAIVTHVQTEEEKLRESLGDTGESDDEWIGLREQEVIQKNNK